MNTINIGNKIKELRKKKGITQEVLADVLYVSPQAVSKWESGLTYPDMTIIPAIARYFEISLDALFDYDLTEMKFKVQKIIQDAWEYFFSDTPRYVETMKTALKDYPGNEELLSALLDAYMRLAENNNQLDNIIETAQKLISESNDFVLICNTKGQLAEAYLKKNEYEKAKRIYDSLPEYVALKNDQIALGLKGKDKLNGAILSRCNHLQQLYIACKAEGDAWFKMDEHNVTFRDYTSKDYIPEALKSYRKGLSVIEAFLIDGKTGQEQYLWDGMQTFHYSFYQCIGACYKKLGIIDECEKAIAEAYRIVSTAWDDFDENTEYYMDPFNEYMKDCNLEEYIK